jgi:hypothetical protein
MRGRMVSGEKPRSQKCDLGHPPDAVLIAGAMALGNNEPVPQSVP